MATNTERYFNFPIQFLNGFMYDTETILLNIQCYALYDYYLKIYKGSAIDRIEASAKFFNLSLKNSEYFLNYAENIYEKSPANAPKVGLNLSIYWDFYKNDKTEFDKICLLGFLGIKSILGDKAYYKLTNKNWLSRMDGKPKAVNDYLELSDEIQKYANEYQLKKIKMALRENWGLVTYSNHNRGFYVSFTIDLKQLITIAEKNRKAIKEKQYKEKEKEILKEVLFLLDGKC